MSVSPVNNSNSTNIVAQGSAASGAGPEQSFLDYMKKSPGQRMVDEWLQAHGLTEQSLQQLPPQQREAIEKQMADDIKKKAEEATQKKLALARL